MTHPVIIFFLILCIPVGYRFYTHINSNNTEFPAPPVKHLAIIMDGNRRWAKKQGVAREMGHRQGAEMVRRLIQYCLERKIEIISVYAFSLENFQRSPEEVKSIFAIMVEQADKALPDLIKNGVKVRFIGDQKMFPESVHSTIERVEEKTKDGTKLLLNVLFCYGGRQEILTAVRNIIKDVKAGKITDVDENTFKDYLWTSTLPDPDLIIRTGGIKRLSNFLTYQTSYSELYFTERLWPDLTAKDLDAALMDYARRKRNFGK